MFEGLIQPGVSLDFVLRGRVSVVLLAVAQVLAGETFPFTLKTPQ
jgi:hypothetical protein